MWKPMEIILKDVATNIYQDNQLRTFFKKASFIHHRRYINFLKRVFFYLLQCNFVQKEE